MQRTLHVYLQTSMIAIAIANTVSAQSDVNDAPGGAQAAQSSTVVHGALGRELDELLSGCAQWGFSGSVVVARDGQIILQSGYGLANRQTDAACSPDTLFEIASCTKHFTAIAILQLEEAGTLSTRDSIAKWLDGVPQQHHGVTIQHLLDHTSGFPRMGPAGTGLNADLALEVYLSGGRVREPGASYEYWNGGYALLAMIIERASGQTYQAYCHEHLFQPAGMTDTGFCGESTFDADLLAHGYDGDHDVGSASSHSYGWEYKGMGGIVTTIADLQRWDRALQGGGVLRSLDKLQQPSASGYAGGDWVRRTKRGTTEHMLGGNVAGFNSTIWRYPDEDAFIAVLCNTPSFAIWVGSHIASRVFDEPGRMASPPAPIGLDADARSAFTGHFQSNDGCQLHIEAEADGFRVSVEGQRAVQVIMYGDPAVPDHVQSIVDNARDTLRGVLDDDYATFRRVMSPNIPADWPQRFRSYWREQVQGKHSLGAIELIGAKPTSMGPSSMSVRFRIRCDGDDDVYVALMFDAGRLVVFTRDEPGPAVNYHYIPTSQRTLSTYSIGPGTPSVIVRDDQTGDLTIRGPRGHALRFQRVQAAHDSAR